MQNFVFRAFLLIVILFVALVLFFSGFRVIEDGQMGVEIAAIGQPRVLPDPLPAGWYWRRPLMISIRHYEMREMNVTISIGKALTADKREISVDCTVYYQIMPEKLVDLHKQYGQDYKISEKMRKEAQMHIYGGVKNFNRQEIFAHSKEKLIENVKKNLMAEWEESGVKINSVVLDSISFPSQYTKEIADYYPSNVKMERLRKECFSKDKKRFFLNLQVYYHIEPQDAEFVHNRLGTGYLKGFVMPRIESIVDPLVVAEDLEKIYASQSRIEIAKKLRQEAQSEMLASKIKIDDITLESLEFDSEYQKLLDEIQRTQKRIEQLELAATVELKQEEISMQKKLKEQEIQLKEAETQKAADLIRAEGYKRAEILKAEGKAEALLKVQKVIAENPALLRFLYVDKISDKVQVIVVPAQADGFMTEEAMKVLKQKGE